MATLQWEKHTRHLSANTPTDIYDSLLFFSTPFFLIIVFVVAVVCVPPHAESSALIGWWVFTPPPGIFFSFSQHRLWLESQGRVHGDAGVMWPPSAPSTGNSLWSHERDWWVWQRRQQPLRRRWFLLKVEAPGRKGAEPNSTCSWKCVCVFVCVNIQSWMWVAMSTRPVLTLRFWTPLMGCLWLIFVHHCDELWICRRNPTTTLKRF